MLPSFPLQQTAVGPKMIPVVPTQTSVTNMHLTMRSSWGCDVVFARETAHTTQPGADSTGATTLHGLAKWLLSLPLADACDSSYSDTVRSGTTVLLAQPGQE